jgi:hypothetical protein
MRLVLKSILAASLMALAAVAAPPTLSADATPEPAPPEGPPPADAPAAAPPAAESPAVKDSRPLVRLTVRNDFRPEDKFFPQLVEGRLVADLADMETFRTAGRDAKDVDYALNIFIRDIAYNTSTVYTTSKDADASSSPEASNQVLLSVDLYYTLEDRQGKLVHEGKLSTSASHEIEKSSEYTSNLLKQEMIDRAAQRIERLVRKKIKKRIG